MNLELLSIVLISAGCTSKIGVRQFVTAGAHV